ncbi:transposase [Thiohalocapsa halophila]|uniref:Transposase n=1 Tax=Thiohalocapsa halophila TaxID=69359 RepID=A0ABS1CPR0_9GAMM|nr:IS1634 family transposase [Thiohalocapsa halophila]MBK1633474.1 transposase [Thiohalocapsa halophila]
MYIRRTTIKSRRSGEPYFTYRLVESIREGGRVRQRTLLNLGRHFEVPQAQWPALAQRIEALVGGQAELFVADLDARWEQAAQHYAAQVIRARAGRHDASRAAGDYHSVDVGAVEVVRPRSVAVEHVALAALRQIGLDGQLAALGFNGPQRAAAIGTLIGRMVAPGSELATHQWLQQRSALGELIDFDFTALELMALYRISDRLLAHKPALEAFLYARERDLFELDEVITLYDLTNTYFEGTAAANRNAAFGKSKEKRTDCPLVTLALVLDASGFPKRSEVFAGNAAEAQTLAEMVRRLAPAQREAPPTVVLDAGIATEENIAWLNQQGYRYVVVSRRRHRQFDPEAACLIKADGALTIRAQRVVNEDTGEVELYCHSTQREEKERGIADRFAQRFEAALQKLADGLHKPRTVKRYEKVLEAIGRLKQKYPRAAQYYEISVEQDETGPNAKAIHWQRVTPVDDTLPGVYCLRTNQTEWDERTLWQTYVTLTDLEAVFRSLKSELGLRPVYHHKTDRVSGHLFISVLAYHLVHTIRLQLKACGIHLSWEGIRRELDGQDRVTVELKREDGRTVHVRKATRAEPRQQLIYDALGVSDRPGQQQITVV